MARKKKKAPSGNTLKKSVNNTGRNKRSGPKTSFRISFANFFLNEKVHMVFGLFLALFSIYLLIAFISFIKTRGADDLTGIGFIRLLSDRDTITVHNVTGRLGGWISFHLVKQWFGVGSFVFPLIFFVTGVRIFLRYQLIPFSSLFKHSFFWLLWLSVAFGFLITNPENELSILGGAFGLNTSEWITGILGRIGTGAVVIFSAVAYFIWVFDAWDRVIDAFDKRRKELVAGLERKTKTGDLEGGKYNTEEYYIPDVETNFQADKNDNEKLLSEDIITNDPVTNGEDNINNGIDFTVVHPQEEPQSEGEGIRLEIEPETADESTAEKSPKERYDLETLYNPKLDLRDYRFPTVDLLDYHGTNTISVQKSELESNKNRIIQTLKNYAIDIERIKATIGPTVTLYEIVPAPGIRISKIKNLEDDIALSLSALGIRIIAPIPGKGTIGIEVPNMNPEIVSMRTILSSERFRNNKYELPIGLGKTIANETYVADLTRMPHLLIAGATGQGKSVGLNAIIASLLYTKHPAELKFVLVDPKKVELSLFSRIQRHFLAKLPDTEEAIITDNRVVVRTLNSLCIEMDNRYNMLKSGGVRNIFEYNSKFIARNLNPLEGHRFMPYIVLIVDEFADLIMMSGKEIEGPIARLAQLARAVGIHLVIATQRPSVNIITGTIKANFPARIAFRVTAKVDSRTILDSGGAEQLVGRGDMLLYTGSDITRLQCAFMDIPEVEKITDFIGSQRGYPEAYELPDFRDDDDEGLIDFDPEDRDELFEEAARLIVRHQHGSTSLLQRKLKLGYNRAGRLIDQLEAAGVVGPFEGSKAREVLFTDEISLEQYLKKNL